MPNDPLPTLGTEATAPPPSGTPAPVTSGAPPTGMETIMPGSPAPMPPQTGAGDFATMDAPAMEAPTAGGRWTASAIEAPAPSQLGGTEGPLTAGSMISMGTDGARPDLLKGSVPSEGAAKIGRYEILHLLGEGGFGSVFLAEQRVPVRRKVALKVVKLGMDTVEVLQRFEAERQALALMDHPNVARVYDAGVTDRGQPFFAMEYVEGVPLNRYLDDNALSIEQRLTLFVDICRAVQHAHGKGLIHRDLKPGNIIVATVDAKPLPKVIDFGIAKATGPNITDTNFQTETGRLIGTPEYMSPEQCSGSVDIDTRTDVYALGVILYEALTGHLPFDSKMLRSGGIDGITRIIREVEPPRPSAKLAAPDVTGGDLLAKVLKARKTDLRHLQRKLKDDLDWIVLKALEKDRNRRYDTANALAMDIVRHLANEPVSAGPPGLKYRFEKFARRNKILFATISAVAAALVIGLTMSVIGFVQASHQRDLAKQAQMIAEEQTKEAVRQKLEALRANQATAGTLQQVMVEAAMAEKANNFLIQLFSAVKPSEARGREVSVYEIVMKAIKDVDAGALKDQPEVEMTMRSALGSTLRALGYAGQAQAQTTRAVEIAHSLINPDKKQLVTLLNRATLAARDAGDPSAAMKFGDEAVTVATAAFGEQSVEVAGASQNLALVHLGVGRLPDAERMFRKALDILEAKVSPDDSRLATVRNNLAALYHTRRDYDSAEKMYRRSLATMEEKLGADHPGTAAALRNLALLLHDKYTNDHDPKTLAEAEALLVRAVIVSKLILPPNHPEYRDLLQHLADARQEGGNLDGAIEAVKESLAGYETYEGHDAKPTLETLAFLTSLHQQEGDLEGAIKLSADLVARAEKTLNAEDPADGKLLASYLALQGTLLLDSGKPTEAEAVIGRALKLRETLLPVGDWRRANTQSLMGAVWVAQGKYAEAEPVLFEAYQMLRSNAETPTITVQRAKGRLFALYTAWGKTDEAGRYK